LILALYETVSTPLPKTKSLELTSVEVIEKVAVSTVIFFLSKEFDDKIVFKLEV